MRSYFRNTKRPKLVAESLTVVFPMLKHTVALEWAAKIFGYRNWHELNASANESVSPTPLSIYEVDPDSPGFDIFLERAEFQTRKLQELLGLDRAFATRVAGWTIHATTDTILRSPKCLMKVPSGLRPLHASVAYDRFFFGGKPTDDFGSMDYGEACYACYEVLPGHLDVAVLQSDFISRIHATRGNLQAQVAAHLCYYGGFRPAEATFHSDEQGTIEQQRVVTLFLYDEVAGKIRGIGQFLFAIEVGYSQGAKVRCRSQGVVLEPGFAYLADQMGTVVAQKLNLAVDMLTWVQVGGSAREDVTIEIYQFDEVSDASEVTDVVEELVSDESNQRAEEHRESERELSVSSAVQ